MLIYWIFKLFQVEFEQLIGCCKFEVSCYFSCSYWFTESFEPHSPGNFPNFMDDKRIKQNETYHLNQPIQKFHSEYLASWANEKLNLILLDLMSTFRTLGKCNQWVSCINVFFSSNIWFFGHLFLCFLVQVLRIVFICHVSYLRSVERALKWLRKYLFFWISISFFKWRFDSSRSFWDTLFLQSKRRKIDWMNHFVSTCMWQRRKNIKMLKYDNLTNLWQNYYSPATRIQRYVFHWCILFMRNITLHLLFLGIFVLKGVKFKMK